MGAPPLNELARHYRDRDAAARAWRASGGKVAGYLGTDVPRELIIAAGLLPIRVTGHPAADTQLADRYVGPGLDPATRSQLNRLLEGTYDFVDYLVIGHDHHGLARLFYTLREIQRVEPRPGLPEFHFVDLLHLPHRTSAVYNRRRVQEFVDVLERWSGRAISAEHIRAAVAVCNANRRLLQQVATLRTCDPPRLTGAEALQIVGAGMMMPVQEHSRLVEDLLAEAHRLPEHAGVRVFLTGSAHDSLAVYELLESRGAIVIGEDHDWGNRSFADLVDESVDAFDALVDRVQLGAPASAKRGIVERATYTAERAAAGMAEVVISFILDGDDAPAWDVAQQRARLAELETPLFVLLHQPYRHPETSELARQIDTFLASSPSRGIVSV